MAGTSARMRTNHFNVCVLFAVLSFFAFCASAFRPDQRWISEKDMPRLLKEYRSAAKKDPQNYTAMVLFGEVLMKNKQLRKAHSAFKRARKLRPHHHPRLFENFAELAYLWEQENGKPLPGVRSGRNPYEIPQRLVAQPRRRQGRDFWPLSENPRMDGEVGQRSKLYGIQRTLSPSELAELPETEITLTGGRDGFFEFVTSEKFEKRYWEKSPVLIHAPRALEDMLSLDDVLNDPMGYLYNGEKRQHPNRNVKFMKEHFSGVADEPVGIQYRKELLQALENGYTMQMLGVHYWMKPPARFAIDLARATMRLTSINLYVTPPSVETSLSPHTDFQDSFMVQLHGRKRWRLWKFPDLRLPIRHRHIKGRDSGDEVDVNDLGEPLLDVVLSPGDVLFVPRGCVHTTSTPLPASIDGDADLKSETRPTPTVDDILKQSSMHLTVGVEVMADVTASFQWEAFFGGGAFFRHDHVMEGFHTALGQIVDKDLRFREGVPTSMLELDEEEEDKGSRSSVKEWKSTAKTLMHAVVDEMFENTDFAETTQEYFRNNLLANVMDTRRSTFPLLPTMGSSEKGGSVDL